MYVASMLVKNKITPTRCRRLRHERQFTQAKLAAAAGLSHPSIVSNFENGRLRLSEAQATKIEEVLR